MDLLTGGMSSLWEKRKILSLREVNSNFTGIMRQGKLCFDLYETEENYVLVFYSLYST